MEAKQVIVEAKYNAPLSKVWKAITNPADMKGWYFDLPGFTAAPGYQFSFTGGPAPDRQYVHLCQVEEVIAEKKLSYTWRYEGFAGNSLVSFDLLPDGEATLLRLTHSGLDSFPADNPDFAVTNFMQGWNHIIPTALRNYLEGPQQ